MSLADALLASLSPNTRSQAESTLSQWSTGQPQFVTSLLQLVLDPAQPIQARQAAAVYFKNTIKRRWDAEENEEPPIDAAEKVVLRNQLVPAMVSLSSQSKLLRAQIAEAVGLVAAVDFPKEWPDLLTQLVAHLSAQDYAVNVCILETAHSIFAPWRSQMRSDDLYEAINYAVSQFQEPFFAVFSATAQRLLEGSVAPDYGLMAQAQVLLTQLYLDLTFHDIPPAFEDSVSQFFGPESGESSPGFFITFLKWDPPELRGDADDPSPTEPMQVKATILEICEVFTMKYSELLGPRIPAFVRAVWELIGASTLAVREDAMVAQAIKFLSVTAKTGVYTQLFGQPATLQGLVDGIIVPSMPLREHEVEQFEDDPLEYIRRDLTLSTDIGSTRRHAASELIRALASIGLEAQVTHLIENYINLGLQDYSRNQAENWKSKDTAIYLLTAIAAQASTSQRGVTSRNMLVDIVKFFTDNIAQDLSADMSTVHPILQVDAIRFLNTFRYQLTKEQLASVFPFLIRHTASSNYVCYTYSAITIERILFMKTGNTPMFTYTDIESFSNTLLNALFARIASGGSPEKVAENEYLMKCVMRVIITSRGTLAATYPAVLSRLVEILDIISKNPSNPLFTQYTFESISALLRFVSLADASSITQFEAALFGPFTVILQQDIDQFIPYVFQILAQMLESHTATLPEAYRSLLPLLLTPPVWAQRGNVPALVRLINAFLAKDAASMEAQGQIRTAVAIIQQRLIPSKLNDQFAFELLQTLVQTVPPQALIDVYFPAVLNALFTRLQSSKTDKFSYGLAHWVFYTTAIDVQNLGPEALVAAVEKIQPGLWPRLFVNIVLPEVGKARRQDQRVFVVGLAKLLTGSQSMLTPTCADAWKSGFQALEALLTKTEAITKEAEADDTEAAITAIDYEEATAGYQASFSKLIASQPKVVDPVAYVPDAPAFAKQVLASSMASPSVRELVTTLPPSPWKAILLS